MKLVILGDIHGRTCWKDIIEYEKPDKVIFLGDYVSTHYNISDEDQFNNLVNILNYKKENPEKVILLRGNHDMQHLGYEWAKCSGWFPQLEFKMQEIKEEFLENTQWMHREENIVFSHAGISKVWMKDNNISSIEDINNLEPSQIFGFTPDNYMDYCGESATQPPTWIRLRSLQYHGIDNYVQVVGHTPVNYICNISKDLGDDYPEIWACDNLPKEYLVIHNGKFKVKEYDIKRS
jgi:predicted phosphodiesterase